MQASITKTESVAKVLIINALNQALILTVGEYKEHPEKSFKPDLPGGLVEFNESERDAAIRETEEEAGVQLKHNDVNLAYTETKFYPDENKSVSKFLYLSVLSNTPEVTVSWEHSAYEWVPVELLTQKIEFRPFYKEAIEYCFASKLL